VLVSPPYPPFLNPIEEFWSKVKAGVSRSALTADDRLSDRICESVQMVSRAVCQHGFVMRCHSFQGASEKIQPVRRQNGLFKK
jgi:hypothetical protein